MSVKAYEDLAHNKRLALRQLLQRQMPVIMPGGFSPIYARMAQKIGFEAFFLSGSQMSIFLAGVPDTTVLGLRDYIDHARHVTARSEIPILMDGDTGFGNAINVYFTVHECLRAGISGLVLEDLELPKSRHPDTRRRCISISEATSKIRAAVAARDELDPDFVICARCESIGSDGGTFDEAVARCVSYVTDGKADIAWLTGVRTRVQARYACKTIPGPILLIWAGGDEPYPTLEEWKDIGVRILLYPTLGGGIGVQATWELMNRLKSDGPEAVFAWRKQAAANPWGGVNLRNLLDEDKIKLLEDEYLIDH